MKHKPKYNVPPIGLAALMLQWLTYRDKPIYRDINHYPSYFYYDYGIENPQSAFYDLYSKGYLEKSSIESSLSFYTIKELLEISSQLGLVLKGKKPAIIENLLATNDYENIESLLPHGPCFSVTVKGMNVIREGRKYVPEDHQHLFEIRKNKNEVM